MKFNLIKNISSDINTPAIELYGNKRVVVFDCKSVIDYSHNMIALDLGEYRIKISGMNLCADSFAFGQTDITGIITGLEFV